MAKTDTTEQLISALTELDRENRKSAIQALRALADSLEAGDLYPLLRMAVNEAGLCDHG